MDPRNFSSTIKSATCKDTSVQNTITTEESFQHFNYIFNGDIVTGIDAGAIGDLKVQDAVRTLISNKAPGPNGVCGEFCKYSDACVVNFLTKYLKNFLSQECFR